MYQAIGQCKCVCSQCMDMSISEENFNLYKIYAYDQHKSYNYVITVWIVLHTLKQL